MFDFVFSRALLLATICALTLGLPTTGRADDYASQLRDTANVFSFGIGDASIEAQMTRLVFDDLMTNRLNAGLSTKEFHLEMIHFAPKFYWEFIVTPRLCQEAKVEVPFPNRGITKFCPEKLRRSENARARRDLLKSQFEAESGFAHSYVVSWDLTKLSYRSKRLLSGATEYQIQCELAFQDLAWEKNLVGQGFDTKKCDRPF